MINWKTPDVKGMFKTLMAHNYQPGEDMERNGLGSFVKLPSHDHADGCNIAISFPRIRQTLGWQLKGRYITMAGYYGDNYRQEKWDGPGSLIAFREPYHFAADDCKTESLRKVQKKLKEIGYRNDRNEWFLQIYDLRQHRIVHEQRYY
jgi:hypothetical protein